MSSSGQLYYKQQNGEQFDWNKYLQTQSSQVTIIDISQQGITYIPIKLLEKCPNLEYLYLEGNELTELSEDFFPSLTQLRWLDIRNNKLTTIPKTIVDHPSLQVLLLEGNQLETLPVEVGSITSLRGIQLARNPLVYPPPGVLKEGAANIVDYLRKQWQTLQSPQHIQMISEPHSQRKSLTPNVRSSGERHKSAVVEMPLKTPGHESRTRRPRNTHSSSGVSTGLSNCISVRPISQAKQHHQKEHMLTMSTVGSNWFTDEESDLEIRQLQKERNFKRKGSIPRKKSLPTFEKISRAKEEVQPKQLRDIWIEKIRQLLLTQETILQRRK